METDMNARQIIREARAQSLDPVEHTLDLADGYGWDEDMTDDAVRRVRASLRFATAAGHESGRPTSWTIDGFTIHGVEVTA